MTKLIKTVSSRGSYMPPFTEMILIRQEKAFLTSYEVKPVEEEDLGWD